MKRYAGLNLVFAQVWHSCLYLFWAIIYLQLIFVQQPLVYITVATADWLWLRWPWNGLRDFLIESFKGLVCRISPKLAAHFLARTPFGRYVGSDRSRPTGNPKQLPLHSVSLNGCAWMLPYHIGVCEVLKERNIVDENTIWLGSSGGALIAAAMALDLDLDYELKFCVSMGMESSEQHALGPAGKMSQYISPHVLQSLPMDAHKRASGRLYLSVTETPHENQVYGNALIGEFKSRNHLHAMLMASSYIPIYYETPVRPGIGVFFWDGGFSNNQPILKDEVGHVITTTVSPSATRADISPKKQVTCNIEHLFPGNFQSAMNAYERGKADGNDYVDAILTHNKACTTQFNSNCTLRSDVTINQPISLVT